MIARIFAFVLALFATSAIAQTTNIEMPAPQTTPFSEYVTGWDESGFITSKQVDFSDLSFYGVFGATTTSNTDATIALGNVVLYLNDTTGFAVDYTVQVRSQQDPQAYFYGIITALDTGSGAATIAVTIAPAFAEFQNWTVQVVAGPTFGLPASSSSGVIANTFSVPAQGDTVTTTTDTGKAYMPGASVYVQSIADYTAYFIGTVFSYNSATGDITVFVRQAGGSGSVTAWTISMVDTAGADANLIGYSSSSVTPAAGDITFTTQSGKFMPVGGTAYVACLTAGTSLNVFGTVKVYTSTSLIITATANMIFGSGSCSAWSIYLVAGPPPGIPLFQRNGLLLTASSSTVLAISAGSVRDSTNTIDLVLSSSITKDVTAAFAAGSGNGAQVTVQGAGTISVSGGVTVTGSGTAFTTFFGSGTPPAAHLSDIDAQAGTTINKNNTVSWLSNTSVAQSAGVTQVTDDTDAQFNNGGTTTNKNYFRGGWGLASAVVYYGVVLVRKDSNGSIDVALTSFTTSGNPDLPSGYTYYRVLGYFSAQTSAIFQITQINLGLTFNQLAPTTTEGDLIYYHSSTNARLPIGSAGTVLTSNGTDPAWTATTTTVASASFPSATNVTVAIPTGYRDIIVSWSGVSSDTAARAFYIQVSTDGGSTYDTTAANYQGLRQQSGSSPVTNSVATMTNSGFSNTLASATGNGVLTIFGYGTAGFKRYAVDQANTNPLVGGTTGIYLSTSPITNIQLLWSGSGNFDAGTYVVSVDYLLLLFAFRRRKPANDNRREDALAPDSLLLSGGCG